MCPNIVCPSGLSLFAFHMFFIRMPLVQTYQYIIIYKLANNIIKWNKKAWYMYRDTHQNNMAHATNLQQGLFQIDSSVFFTWEGVKVRENCFLHPNRPSGPTLHPKKHFFETGCICCSFIAVVAFYFDLMHFTNCTNVFAIDFALFKMYIVLWLWGCCML